MHRPWLTENWEEPLSVGHNVQTGIAATRTRQKNQLLNTFYPAEALDKEAFKMCNCAIIINIIVKIKRVYNNMSYHR